VAFVILTIARVLRGSVHALMPYPFQAVIIAGTLCWDALHVSSVTVGPLFQIAQGRGSKFLGAAW